MVFSTFVWLTTRVTSGYSGEWEASPQMSLPTNVVRVQNEELLLISLKDLVDTRTLFRLLGRKTK